MKSLFRCPLCGAPLEREEHRRLCPAGHSFDKAALRRAAKRVPEAELSDWL